MIHYFFTVVLLATWFDYSMFWILFAAFIYWNYSYKKNKRKKIEEENKALKALKKEEIKLLNLYHQKRTQLIEKYGDPTNAIVLEPHNLERELIVFEKSNRIWICGKDLPMKSIIDCQFIDNQTVEKGMSNSHTQTSNSNVLGRAIVGDLLFGTKGAVIGGMTASTTTTTYNSDDYVRHDYTVLITIDSLSEPIIRIPLHEDEKTVNEVVAIIKVIINRRQTIN